MKKKIDWWDVTLEIVTGFWLIPLCLGAIGMGGLAFGLAIFEGWWGMWFGSPIWLGVIFTGIWGIWCLVKRWVVGDEVYKLSDYDLLRPWLKWKNMIKQQSPQGTS